jgi:hypothetical protein
MIRLQDGLIPVTQPLRKKSTEAEIECEAPSVAPTAVL